MYNRRERNRKWIIERKWKGSKKDDMKWDLSDSDVWLETYKNHKLLSTDQWFYKRSITVLWGIPV